MITVVTSIGEQTTDLCVWSLKRLNFKPEVLNDPDTTLWQKLEMIYYYAKDEDILRVDADVVVNKNILEMVKQDKLWWYQALCYGWFNQDVIHGGVQFIRKQSLPAIRYHLQEARKLERPESYLSRLPEFHNPRVFGTFEKVCGIHGYGQFSHDVIRAKATKIRRNQYENYDFELAERLSML